MDMVYGNVQLYECRNARETFDADSIFKDRLGISESRSQDPNAKQKWHLTSAGRPGLRSTVKDITSSLPSIHLTHVRSTRY